MSETSETIYRVLTEHGASYGSFSDYALALGQAEHLASPRRRLRQLLSLQQSASIHGPWTDVLVFERDGTLRGLVPAPSGHRRRLSSLAA